MAVVVITGASLTASTVTVIAWVPTAPPASVAATVKVSVPLKLAFGV